MKLTDFSSILCAMMMVESRHDARCTTRLFPSLCRFHQHTTTQCSMKRSLLNQPSCFVAFKHKRLAIHTHNENTSHKIWERAKTSDEYLVSSEFDIAIVFTTSLDFVHNWHYHIPIYQMAKLPKVFQCLDVCMVLSPYAAYLCVLFAVSVCNFRFFHRFIHFRYVFFLHFTLFGLFRFAFARRLDAALLNFYVVMCFLAFNSTVFLKSVDLLFDYRAIRYIGANNTKHSTDRDNGMCLCVFSSSSSTTFFSLLPRCSNQKNSTHNEFCVWYNFFFVCVFFHFFSFLVVDIRFFRSSRTAWLCEFGRWQVQPYYFPFHFSCFAHKNPGHNNPWAVYRVAFSFSGFRNVSSFNQKKNPRTKRVLIFRSRITSITAMKMDHFIKSLLLNMIVVWNFPIYILKRSYSSRFDFILILLWFSGVVSTRLRNYRSHLWLFSFWTIKFEAPISIRYTFIPINLVFKLGNFPTKQRETSRWETNGMH